MKKESYRFLNISINNGSDKKKKSNFFVKIKNGTDLKDTKKDRIRFHFYFYFFIVKIILLSLLIWTVIYSNNVGYNYIYIYFIYFNNIYNFFS